MKTSAIIYIYDGFTSKKVPHNDMVSSHIKVLEAQCRVSNSMLFSNPTFGKRGMINPQLSKMTVALNST